LDDVQANPRGEVDTVEPLAEIHPPV
jgi:hypothetical protein